MSSHTSTSANPSSLSHGGGNATAAAAAAAAATKARMLRMAIAQHHNEHAAWCYAVGMGSLIALFTIYHWSRFFYSRYASKGLRESSLMKAEVGVTRILRHVLTRRFPGFLSVGHVIVIAVFLGINIALTVTFIDWTSLVGIGKRCGWMALLNMAFITLLALKNTPLAFLTAYSYERLNPLHQVGGYTTVTYALIHLTVLSKYFTKVHKPSMLLLEDQIYGMIAACGMFVMLITAIIIRSIRYEIFYIIHITMYIIVVITIGLHRPVLAERALIITIVAGSMWASDRILRGCRILWYSHDNLATITPLPHGGTRISLTRCPSRAVPGNHCFVWIPKIRAFETHPFTVVSTTSSSLELVVAEYDGFTHDLHKYALSNPGAILQASVDGTYGAAPNFAKIADKVILIAGGSGASFTFGIALDMLKKLAGSSKTTIDFVWCVKEQDYLSWFSKELAVLEASPLVTTHIHVTRSPTLTHKTSPPSLRYVAIDDEKNRVVSEKTSAPSLQYIPTDDEKPTNITSPTSKRHNPDFDIEKHSSPVGSPISPTSPTNPWDSSASLEIATGRPDISALIRAVASTSGKGERIAIGACGPEALMSEVRKVTASVIRVSGPSVELHCEQFGW